jgi:hypothetical protein
LGIWQYKDMLVNSIKRLVQLVPVCDLYELQITTFVHKVYFTIFGECQLLNDYFVTNDELHGYNTRTWRYKICSNCIVYDWSDCIVVKLWCIYIFLCKYLPGTTCTNLNSEVALLRLRTALHIFVTWCFVLKTYIRTANL